MIIIYIIIIKISTDIQHLYNMLYFLVLKIGFTSDSSVVTSDGKTSFKIGILSGKVQFGVSVRVILTAIGPTEGI